MNGVEDTIANRDFRAAGSRIRIGVKFESCLFILLWYDMGVCEPFFRIPFFEAYNWQMQ